MWSLEFIGGVHAGARVALAPGRWRLGSGADNEIVVADHGVPLDQAVFDIGPNSAQIAVAAPLRARLARGVVRHRRWKPGHVRALRHGTTFTVGASHVRVHGPRPPRRRSRLMVAAATVALVGTFGLGASASWHLVAPAKPVAPALDPPVTATAVIPTLDDAALALRARLAQDGLAGAIAVGTAQGAVTATGQLGATDRDRWTQAQHWFDTTYGGRFVLLPAIATAPANEAPPLDVAAVAMLPIPHVITRAGERYIEGALLDGGWTIERIAADGVTLRQGARTLKMTL